MSVVSRDTRRRWAIVGGAVAALCLLPVAVAAWPAPRVAADPVQLRARIRTSIDQPYQGYVDSRGAISLPDLPALDEVAAMLGGTTRIRVWYASPQYWRVAVLGATGEHDIYRTHLATFIWDFERNLLTQVTGDLPVRLPWAADLPPPDLARRLLAGGEPVTAIPSRREAGIDAPGLRLTPADPDTTIGRVDVWADPSTGLPLRVEVAGRDGRPVFIARFLELNRTPPTREVLRPARTSSAGYTVTAAPDVAAAIQNTAPIPLPETLAGRARVANAGGVAGVAGYGRGLSMFVVLPLPGRLGYRSMLAAGRAGALPVKTIPRAEGYEMRSSILTTLIVRSTGDPLDRRTFLLAGLVSPDLLIRAAADLIAEPAAP